MKPVEQTHLTPPLGNCFAACIASVLEIGLDDVPNFTGDDWFRQWNIWLEPLNLHLLSFPASPDDSWRPPGYALGGVKSPRGDWDHAVVFLDGQLVWDPHPQRELGIGAIKDWQVFVVLNPAKPPKFLPRLAEGWWYHCPTPGCPDQLQVVGEYPCPSEVPCRLCGEQHPISEWLKSRGERVERKGDANRVCATL